MYTIWKTETWCLGTTNERKKQFKETGEITDNLLR